jgi:hypothetical protein
MLGEQIVTWLTEIGAPFSDTYSIAFVSLVGLFLAGFLGVSGLKYMYGAREQRAPGPDEIDDWFENRED